MTVLRARDLTWPEFHGLIGGLRFPPEEPIRIWLEAADGWCLAYWRGMAEPLPWYRAGCETIAESAEEVLRRAYSGRVFAPSGELRWRVLPMLGQSAWRTVYLGEDLPCVALLQPSKELQGLQPTSAEYPLWGLLTAATRRNDGQAGDWVELRIPHRFRYPVAVPKESPAPIAVKACVEQWCDARGDLHFMRLCDLSSYTVGG